MSNGDQKEAETLKASEGKRELGLACGPNPKSPKETT